MEMEDDEVEEDEGREEGTSNLGELKKEMDSIINKMVGFLSPLLISLARFVENMVSFVILFLISTWYCRR